MNKFSVLSSVVLLAALTPGAAAQTLVLHNTLGSMAEVAASVVGSNLGLGSRPIAFVDAPGGRAMTVATASAGNAPVLLTGLASVISTERGTVESVFQMTAPPVANQFNPYLLFDGDFGAGSGIGLEVWNTYSGTTDLIGFLEFGGTRVYAVPLAFPTRLGYPMEGLARRWLHAALVWDRNGIDGSSDRVRVYLNGVLVSAAAGSGWGMTVGNTAEIGGANDCCPQNKLHYDDIKIWDSAKTAFDIPINVWLQSLNGPGSVTLSNGGATSGNFCFNVISLDPANAGPGFGSGAFFGLHVSFLDVVTQFTTPGGPFLVTADSHGGQRFDLPAGSLPSGLLLASVALELLPGYTIAGASPVVLHTIP